MKQKPRMRITLTFYIGVILLISNMMMVSLLIYNFGAALSGFLIPVKGEFAEYFLNKGLEAELLAIGIIIALITTSAGTLIIYIILGKMLSPLQELSEHMQESDKENILSPSDISSDVREIDSLVNSFNIMTRKLQKIFENQKYISSFIAHEFRTPLAVIQTKIDVYQKHPENPDETISLISHQISKLSLLVTQILKLSAIQRVELKDRVPIYLLLDEVIEDLEDFADENQVTLEITSPEAFNNIKMDVIGSHDLLYQAFYNLVQNGIKYNHSGGSVIIEVKKAQRKIIVNIRDTGRGIPQQEREKIFFPFYRCQNNISEIKGNGIGLALSKQIFEHHKGSLSLKDVNVGSCFTAILNEYRF